MMLVAGPIRYGLVAAVVSTMIMVVAVNVAQRAPARVPPPQRFALAWPSLDPQQITALTGELRLISKRDVTVWCRDWFACGDLWIALQSAFDQAGWTVRADFPYQDSAGGLLSNDVALAVAIERATKLDVDLVAGSTERGSFVWIGQRR